LAYWLNTVQAPGAPLPVDNEAGRRANTEASARTVTVSLSEDDTRALVQEVPNVYHTQINDVLLTALVQIFARWTGVRSLLVDLEGHGREAIFEDVELSRTVGWFTSIFPVFLNLEKAVGPGDALKAVKEQLGSVPNRGIGYGLLRYLCEDEKVAAQLRSLPQAEVLFNYLGQWDQFLPEGSPFGPTREACGPSHSPRGERCHLLEINGFILEGRLQLEWIYSENVHRCTIVEWLAQGFIEALRALIVHCQLAR
jgi:non-ribosomal peptide synthase protein (TIGR01720 family)